jgi:3-isopropylmalate/(R)-2-methylmalate dehydratase small subunit
MKKFSTLSGVAAPLLMINVDTDMIIPKQFLKTIQRTGLGRYLFNEMRYLSDGRENPDFILNQDMYRSSVILITGANFGCGSSREHATWALLDFGIQCVIAPSFADIFYNNCFKTGILPIALPQVEVDKLMNNAQHASNTVLDVNLERQEICYPNGGDVIGFEIDPFHKHCLLHGLEEISLTLTQSKLIETYESHAQKLWPWLFKPTQTS